MLLTNFISTALFHLTKFVKWNKAEIHNDLETNLRTGLFKFYNCINFLANLTDKCISSANNSYNFSYNSFGM